MNKGEHVEGKHREGTVNFSTKKRVKSAKLYCTRLLEYSLNYGLWLEYTYRDGTCAPAVPTL